MADFSGQMARDSARQHNGNVYYNNYYGGNRPDSQAPRPEPTQEPRNVRPLFGQNALDMQLIMAAERLRPSRVRYLLSQGARTEAADEFGRTALIRACEFSGPELPGSQKGAWTKALLTPLQQRDQEDIVAQLLQAGADANVTRPDGPPLLHLAVQRGCIGIVDLLIKGGVDIDWLENRSWAESGGSALHKAVQHGRQDAVEALIRAGADVNLTDGEGLTALHVAAAPKSLDAVEPLVRREGSYTLHVAASRKTPDVIKALVRAGADVNAMDHRGGSALHTAATCDSLDVMEALLRAGANLNATDHTGDSALHTAAAWGSLNAMEALFQAGVDVNLTNCGGTTALHAAVWGHSPDGVKAIMRAGGDANRKRHLKGNTALHDAVDKYCDRSAKSASVVEALVQTGADISTRNEEGYSSLHWAISRGSPRMVDVLIAGTADLEDANVYYWGEKGTPLAFARGVYAYEKDCENRSARGGHRVENRVKRCGQVVAILREHRDGAERNKTIRMRQAG